MLRLRHGHAVAGNDHDALRVGQQQRCLVGLNGFDRFPGDTVRRRCATAAGGAERAEQNIRDRAVHRLAHEQREQRAGGTNERSRHDHRECCWMAKPSAATARPVKEFNKRNDDRHVRAADGHDHRHAEEQREREHDDERRGGVAAGGVGTSASRTSRE
jgi:hypothetical protein